VTVLALALTVLPVSPRFKKRKLFVFGDSITEAGAIAGRLLLKIGDLAAGDTVQSQFELSRAVIGGNKVYDLSCAWKTRC